MDKDKSFKPYPFVGAAKEDFSESDKTQAFIDSGKQCQCERTGHGHYGRCPTKFRVMGDAHFHHKNRAKPAVLSNCEVLCIDCHEKTYSYGKPLP